MFDGVEQFHEGPAISFFVFDEIVKQPERVPSREILDDVDVFFELGCELIVRVEQR